MISSVKHKALFHRNSLEKGVFLNTKYANFGLASSVVQTSQVRLGSVSSLGRNDASPVIFDNISQLASATAIFLTVFTDEIQWGKKVFSQPPIVQVLPLKKMREACNFHHRYTSTMRDKIRKKKSRKSHCRIFKEFICKLWWKISIWSITKFHLNTLLNTLCWQ